MSMTMNPEIPTPNHEMCNSCIFLSLQKKESTRFGFSSSAIGVAKQPIGTFSIPRGKQHPMTGEADYLKVLCRDSGKSFCRAYVGE